MLVAPNYAYQLDILPNHTYREIYFDSSRSDTNINTWYRYEKNSIYFMHWVYFDSIQFKPVFNDEFEILGELYRNHGSIEIETEPDIRYNLFKKQ